MALQATSGAVSKRQMAGWETAAAGQDEFVGNVGVNNRTKPIHFDGKNGSIQITTTGTPTGTLTVLASDDHDPQQYHQDKWNGNWANITTRTTPAPANPAGAGTTQLLSLVGIHARYVYVNYAVTSGAGTITAGFVAEDHKA